jgi:hypothetical protein
MNIDWSREFDRQLDRLEADSSERGQRVYRLLTLMLRRLRELDAAPVEETAMLKRVRQYTVWRVSHPYREGIALRLICWFPPGQDRVVVALFAGEKASMGDVFYDSVGTRADQIIERWLEDTEEES